MNEHSREVSEQELQAHVDGRLDPIRRAAIDAYLSERPDEAARVAHYRGLNDALRARFDPILAEPVPERLRVPLKRRLYPRRWVAALAWLVIGAAGGWFVHGLHGAAPPPLGYTWLPREAAVAHAVYSPEVLHPVEVSGAQEAHLVAWLSKRLEVPLRVPQLSALGYQLVGGRLLPADNGPAAQFMYEDPGGRRLTLYVRVNRNGNRQTAFRYAREDGLGVFYWIDRSLGYALSGNTPRRELLRAAQAAYRQLNP